MYARHIYVTGNPERTDAALEAITTEARPLIAGSPGYAGSAVLADPNLGKILFGALWDSEAERRDAEAQLSDRWAGLLEPFAATITPEDLEVASVFQLKFPQRGDVARRMLVDFDPVETDAIVESFASGAASLADIPGLCRASTLVDRERGRGTFLLICRQPSDLAPSVTLGGRAAESSKMGLAIRSLEEFHLVQFVPAGEGDTNVEPVRFDRFGDEIVETFSWPDEFERPSVLCNVS